MMLILPLTLNLVLCAIVCAPTQQTVSPLPGPLRCTRWSSIGAQDNIGHPKEDRSQPLSFSNLGKILTVKLVLLIPRKTTTTKANTASSKVDPFGRVSSHLQLVYAVYDEILKYFAVICLKGLQQNLSQLFWCSFQNIVRLLVSNFLRAILLHFFKLRTRPLHTI